MLITELTLLMKKCKNEIKILFKEKSLKFKINFISDKTICVLSGF